VDDRGARYPLRIDPLVQQGEKLTGAGEEGQAEFGFSVALSADGKTAVIGGRNDKASHESVANGWGAAWVFTRSQAGNWIQQKLWIEEPEEEVEAEFGFSVALSADGTTALVGGPYDNVGHRPPENKGYGAVWVFTRSGSTWVQQGPKLTGGPEEIGRGSFGIAVALSNNGNTALVGGWTDNSFKGAAWVFTRSGETWTQQGPKITPGDEVGTGGGGAGEGGFGWAVALSFDGNNALIGGWGDSGEHGAAWVFTRAGATWTEQKKLTGSGEEGASKFGFGVALSADGNTALIGGPLDDAAGGLTSGAVWMFTRSQAGTWAQQGNKLTGSSEEREGHFGESVALSPEGNLALIGGPGNLASAGAAWVFRRSADGTWSQEGQELTGAGGTAHSRFGESVALSAEDNVECTTALIGGNYDNGRQGAVWVFVSSPAGPASPSCRITTTSTTHTTTTTSTATPSPPALADVTQSHSRWREGGKLARESKIRRSAGRSRKHRPPVGTTYSFALNEQASVSFAFTQQVRGHKVKGKCVAQTKRNRRRHACRRTVTAGTLSFSGHAGKNSVSFQGRISAFKKLRPGRYTLVITATNSAGQQSRPARLRFTIVK
jgi:hypothetical protein